MISRCLVAAALAACGCGSVDRGPTDGSVSDTAPGTAVAYRGRVAQVPPVTFGGTGDGMTGGPCMYTMTFQQLDVMLTIRPSGDITGGHVQNLNVEKTVGTCVFSPAPNVISNYNFESAKPGPGGMLVAFATDPANQTKATLTMTLSPAGAGFTAELRFHRTDIGVPFDWTVVATVPLAPLAPD